MNTGNNKKPSLFEIFYNYFLWEVNTTRHSVITPLGVAAFKVSNEDFITKLQEAFGTNKIEAEFSFVHDKFLHFKRDASNDKSLGVATLYIRIEEVIYNFIVEIHNNIVVNFYSANSWNEKDLMDLFLLEDTSKESIDIMRDKLVKFIHKEITRN